VCVVCVCFFLGGGLMVVIVVVVVVGGRISGAASYCRGLFCPLIGMLAPILYLLHTLHTPHEPPNPHTCAGTEQWVSTSNALAAHLWPILSALLKGEKQPPPPAPATEEGEGEQQEGEGGEGGLVPLSVVVNSRRQLQMPGHYCGNVSGVGG
jgi:hypothetical protein